MTKKKKKATRIRQMVSGFDVTLEMEVDAEDGAVVLHKKMRLPIPPFEGLNVMCDGEDGACVIEDIFFHTGSGDVFCGIEFRREKGKVDSVIASYKALGWTVDHSMRGE